MKNHTTETWKVYIIEDKQDWVAALALYERRIGVKPRYVRVSEKAPDWLLMLLKEAEGLEVEQATNLLPHDIWLTHERKVEAQPQLSLFEGM